MKCKAHPYANKVGVCAPCLRERLLALAASQNEASSPSPPPLPPSNPISDYFPRSVSPYISCHRRSDASSAGRRHHHHHPPSLLFFRTPQVGPSAPLEEGSITFERKKSHKFSLISALFGAHHSRSGKNSEISEMDSPTRSKSGSWIYSLVKKTRRSKVTEIDSLPRKNWWDPDQERGLSPDRNCDSLESGSCVSDSPWRPAPSPMRRGVGHRKRHGASGFAVCLSPLVRPSPAHRRSQVSETGFSGDLKSPAHHRHVAAGGAPVGPSLCHNRSRKIADIGRHRWDHFYLLIFFFGAGADFQLLHGCDFAGLISEKSGSLFLCCAFVLPNMWRVASRSILPPLLHGTINI